MDATVPTKRTVLRPPQKTLRGSLTRMLVVCRGIPDARNVEKTPPCDHNTSTITGEGTPDAYIEMHSGSYQGQARSKTNIHQFMMCKRHMALEHQDI